MDIKNLKVTLDGNDAKHLTMLFDALIEGFNGDNIVIADSAPVTKESLVNILKAARECTAQATLTALVHAMCESNVAAKAQYFLGVFLTPFSEGVTYRAEGKEMPNSVIFYIDFSEDFLQDFSQDFYLDFSQDFSESELDYLTYTGKDITDNGQEIPACAFLANG